MERALNALGVRELSRHAHTEFSQHDELARPRPPVSSASEKLNSENWKEIELNYCGARVRGSYKVSEKLVTIVYGSGIKTARLGILPAEMLAHMLLREMEFERRETKRNTLGE
jgi:hypothetical protein